MNNNFVFRIFGTPHIFDLYQNSNESEYFMNFYNGSKENTKFTIHRMASGMVSYSYLRYNFISSSGRPNSFFGMSVLFNNEYCKNVENIFALFDTIYKDIVVKNGILLTELKGNSTAQAKYLVRTFAEEESEVKNIENNILNNIRNHFSGDIVPLDKSFLESTSMVKLNDKMGNAVFVNALKKHSWVNISSAFSANEDPIPNLEFLANIQSVIEYVQKQTPLISVNALKGANILLDINNLLAQIENSINKIYNWLEKEYPKGTNLNTALQKQSELQQHLNKLNQIKLPLNDLLNVVENSAPEPTPTLQPLVSGNSTGETNVVLGKNGTQNGGGVPKVPFWKKPQFIAGAVVVLIIVVGAIFLIPKGNDKQVVTSNIPPVEITVPKTEPAESAATQAEKEEETVNNLFEQATTYGSQKNYQKQKECLEQAKQYAYAKTINPNIDNDIAEVQKLIDKQLADAKAKSDKAATGKQAKTDQTTDQTPTPTQPTYTNVSINTTPKKRVYSKGDTFNAEAKSGSEICTGGQWKFEDGLWCDASKNPTKVEIVSVPQNGSAKLTYWVGDTKLATAVIRINP